MKKEDFIEDLNELRENGAFDEMQNEWLDAIDKSIIYIEELEKKDKQYKKLEETNLYLQKLLDDVENLIIPKQKVRDKIKELEREFDFYAGREHSEWEDGEFDGDVCDDIALKIEALKELLKEEKND